MMGTAVPTVQTSKFFNWIKAALAVLYTKEEVEPVVVNEIKDFQQNSLNTISSSNSLPAGSTCSNCCTENLIVCPTNRLCNAKRGKCSYHKNAATQYRQSGCPNKICHNIKSEIQKAHRYHGPSYKNTDATKWCSNVWEIAKCYLPPDGYKDVSNAAETDFNGIISVIINHKGFEAKIQDDLSKKNNIFEKGRDVGRAVRHSPNLEVEDTDLTQYFTILNNILTDPGFVAMNNSSNNAIQKLAKLQSDDLIIGKDVVRKVFDDVGKTIQEQIRNEMDEYKQKTEERKLELINIINLKVKDIEEKGNVSLVQLNGAVQSSIDAFEAKVKESIQEIDSQTRKGKETLESVTNDGVQNFNKEKENAMKEIQKAAEKSRGNDAALKSSIDAFDAKVIESIQEIDSQTRKGKETIESVTNDVNKEKENAIKEIQKAAEKSRGNDANAKISEDTYQKKKEELQGDLIKFYKKRCSSIPLSPLLDEIETPLAGFYVMPDIVAVKQKSLTCHEEERTPIKSLKDLFSTGSGDQQEIYLSADAGFGKTAFSKYLAITWCQAHCHDENYACFKEDELKTLFGFKFLFLVLLRDCTSVCNIDDMIEQQITKKLPSSATIHEVLRREKCLIILDGLDEWTHPVNSCSEVTEKIPHRYVHDNCVILTTTRPWKLGVANLKTSQINKKVELLQLSTDSTRQLEENAIRKMTGVHNHRALKRKRRGFDKVIRDRNLEHMQVIPLLLMYIVCLWCNNIPIGNSKHEIYTNIIEFLLSRTSKKHPEVQPSRESSTSEIPDYFKGHEFCKKFYSLITSLAELAYQTLFNQKRESTLVFDRTVAEKYQKSDDIKLSLLSGILSESRSKTLIKEIIKVSFSHKTVQEFFAAIYISSENDTQKTVVAKCRNIQDILGMSKICEFISKMNADRMCEISNNLMSVINEDEKTRDYKTRTGREFSMYNTPLYSIQKMFMSCLQEMPESEKIQLCLQDFFIDNDNEDSKLLQRLLKQNKTNIKSLYIDTLNTSSSLRDIIDLFSLTDLSHIQKLYYRGYSEKEEADITRILFPSLQNVTLSGGTWTTDEENLSLNLARLQNLQYLYIDEFTLSHKILEIFFNFISGQKSMKELKLWELYCKEHGRHYCKRLMNLDLSQHSTLSKLHLEQLPGRLQLNISTPSLVNVKLCGINLDDESSFLLSRDMLNIERVELSYIEMSAESLQNFITVLKNLPQSVTVKMRAITPETEYERVRENIRRSQTFHVIQDYDSWGRVTEFKTIKPSKE